MIDIPTETITIERFAEGSWSNNGRYEKGDAETFTIEASVQPASGNQVKILPEHRRTEEIIVIYSDKQLRVNDNKKNKSGDTLLHSGKKYEILNVKDWSRTDIPHFECLGVKLDGEGGGDNV